MIQCNTDRFLQISYYDFDGQDIPKIMTTNKSMDGILLKELEMVCLNYAVVEYRQIQAFKFSYPGQVSQNLIAI